MAHHSSNLLGVWWPVPALVLIVSLSALTVGLSVAGPAAVLIAMVWRPRPKQDRDASTATPSAVLAGPSRPSIGKRAASAGGVAAGIFGAYLMAGSGGGRNHQSRPLPNFRYRDQYPMSEDRAKGNAGRGTVYERPDGSWYLLDRTGRGGELPLGTKIHGPAQFDRGTWRAESGRALGPSAANRFASGPVPRRPSRLSLASG